MSWLRNKPELESEPTRSVERPETKGVEPKRGTGMDKLVNIGQSIEIRGELSGNEDLTIDGRVEGKIELRDHNLTIGANGRIKADLFAKTVTVVGEVVGNITAGDRVEITESGSLEGDIVAPRVVLGDGARFKGSIDMDGKARPSTSGVSQPSDKAAMAAGSGKGPLGS